MMTMLASTKRPRAALHLRAFNGRNLRGSKGRKAVSYVWLQIFASLLAFSAKLYRDYDLFPSICIFLWCL